MMTSRAEEDVFLFDLELDHASLTNAFPAFPVKDGFIIPLGELCRLLDLAITVDPNHGMAEGFFIEERRHFSLNVLAGTVTVAGLTLPVDRSLMELHADDIYVDSRLIAQWLPVDLAINQRGATINVVPREPLPLQLRWKRERDSGRYRPAAEAVPLKRTSTPYQLAEIPMVDETLILTGQNTPGVNHPFAVQSTTFATGDLLALSTTVFANVDSNSGTSDLRMTMGRRDPNAELLGPLHATEFAVGEVLNPGVNLLTSPLTGTGALVTNMPLQQANAFDHHSFQGDLPPGWQVEIYRNQSLLSFQASRADGRYEFLNIPLYYGWNDFRLVFYGPQGQRREEVLRFDVSESQTPAGAFQYRFMENNPEGLGHRSQFDGRYGISKQLAADFAWTELDQDGVHHTYTEAGLLGFWKPLSGSITAARDSVGGNIEELGLRSRLGPVSINFKQAYLQDGFVSEVFQPLYGQIQSRTNLVLSAILPSPDRAWASLDLGGTKDRLASGGAMEQLYQRLSTSYQGYFLSNQINRTVGSGSAFSIPLNTTGDFLASKYFKTFSLRAQAEYQLSGGRHLNTLTLAGETFVYQPYLLQATVSHALQNGENTLQLGVNKPQGTYSLGASLTYSTVTRITANLTLRFGLGREPRTGRIYSQAQSMATYGAVSAQAFLDSNNNGVKDPGEKTLEGVGFMVNGSLQPRRTDARGVGFINNLSTDTDANLSVAPNTLEDPLMRPGTPGVRITPRAGHVTQLDVPIILFGEVTGTLYQRGHGKTQEQAGVKLEIIDTQAKVIQALRSSFDGFFDFTGLPPGEYHLRVAPGEAQRLGIRLPEAKAIHISTEGTVLDGMDLILEERAAPEPAPSNS